MFIDAGITHHLVDFIFRNNERRRASTAHRRVLPVLNSRIFKNVCRRSQYRQIRANRERAWARLRVRRLTKARGTLLALASLT